ncbi:RagB/SusD family nutrient uptake outer membrane protein [Solirubrum puertoriconensis]|uniref:Carbohydrate-binding protein SusD n=1 Tax=Solirubrum puertoriconensis TaxID=1751427 RepID=A0A9X0HJ03_SOLP1|nr:RagB/SusD family nutrient uptake outer membrane protein [Solirubrum puertoriconensis]KUG06777.1 hypothetical protein ASU33_05450 [Solirubrum puertoriconensis]
MNNRIMAAFAPHRVRVMALAAFLSLGMASCDVTDLQPLDALPETAAFSTPDRIGLAVTGVYNAAQSGYYDPLNGTALGTRGYPFGSAATALGDVRGEDVVDMAGFFGIVGLNNITPSSPNVVNMWSNLYSTINQANLVIDGVRTAAQNGVISATDAEAYEGEMRFLRALSYHELVINFAKPYNDNNGNNPGVPYRDFPVNNPAALERARALGRTPVNEVYTKMLEDLDFAESKLPANRAGTLKVTRATKGAAIALKQRLRIHQSNWAQAKVEGDKLITGTTTFTAPAANGGYALQATPEAASQGRASVTNENIFSIENSSDDNSTTNGSLGSVFGSPAAAPAGIGGRGLESISPNLLNASFVPCDDRRRTGLTQQNGAAGAVFSAKYKDAATYSDFAPIIRYAEVLLNQAEAEANLGATGEVRALTLLNAVRGRAVSAADLYAGLTGDALIRAILNERRIELVSEGFRWDDIHRLSAGPSVRFSPRPGGGIPRKLDASQAVGANYNCTTRPVINGSVADIPYSDYRFLWPIPAAEIANNPTLASQQNPGY